MTIARALRWSALALLGASLVVLASGLLALAAAGVFTTTAPAWTAEFRAGGMTVRVNVVGLVRLATLPGVARLLDGMELPTRHGRLSFTRAEDGLRIRCTPCRIRHPDLAAAAVAVDLALDVRRVDDRLDGALSIARVRVPFTARLRASAIDLAWRLPPTELGDLYAAFGDAVPEAAFARIEGTVHAEGTLSLPSLRTRARWNAEGLEVGGLGTEALQYGWFRYACPRGDGATKLLISGDGERTWIAADALGPYLAAAVLAAEDQRFNDHAGYDEAALTAILADLDDGRPQRGASTVTQQLARTLFTGGERTAARKLRELLYAIEMERTLGKARILELYLNTVHWGPGVCGAKAAARTYFTKPPARLSAIEAAWLAGALRHPQRAWDDEFRPRRPDRERASRIVGEMRGWPKRERQRFAAQPLSFAAVASRPAEPATGAPLAAATGPRATPR